MHLTPLLALFSTQGLAALLPHVNALAMVLALKVGLIMPLIVSTLAQPRFSTRARTLLSVASCLVAGAIVCFATGVFSCVNWAAASLILLSVSWGLYEHFYKPTGISPWVEQVTTLGGYVIAAFGKSAVAVYQAATSTASAAIEQGNQAAPAALPAPQTDDPQTP